MKNLLKFIRPVCAAGLVLACASPIASASSHESGDTSVAKLVSMRSIHGYDVFDMDGRKAGDVVDAVVDSVNPVRIKHVLIMTGGFIDVGGAVRAIPVEAVSWNGERYVMDVTTEQFLEAPILPDEQKRFFKRASNLVDLANHYDQAPSAYKGQPLFCSDLDAHDIADSEGSQIGFVATSYLSLDEGVVAFLTMVPTDLTLDEGINSGYALPMAKLIRISGNNLVFDTTVQELYEAPLVDETKIQQDSSTRGKTYKLPIEE